MKFAGFVQSFDSSGILTDKLQFYIFIMLVLSYL